MYMALPNNRSHSLISPLINLCYDRLKFSLIFLTLNISCDRSVVFALNRSFTMYHTVHIYHHGCFSNSLASMLNSSLISIYRSRSISCSISPRVLDSYQARVTFITSAWYFHIMLDISYDTTLILDNSNAIFLLYL